MTRLVAWAAAILLAAAFVYLDPKALWTAAGFGKAVRGAHVWATGFDAGVAVRSTGGLLVGAAMGLAQVGLGGAVLRRFAPRLAAAPAGFAVGAWLGFGLASAWWFLLAACGGFYAVPAALPLLGLALLRGAPRPGRWPPLVVAAAVLVAGVAGADAVAPPVDTDEIYQHLALARLIAEGHHLVGGMLHPDGSRPIPVQLGYAALYALGGETAPRAWHLGVVATLFSAVVDLARARVGRVGLGLVALTGSYSFLVEAGLAYNDLPAALGVLVAAQALDAEEPRAFGLAAGLALACKYTAAPALVGLGLVDVLRRRRLPWGAAWALLGLLPWWLRNAVDGLHPLFPYAGWPDVGVQFSFPERYGLGRDPLAFLLLPWHVLMQARTDTFTFLGRVSLAWGLLLPVGLWQRRRDGWAWALLVAGVGWAVGPQLLRYLLPTVGLAAVIVAGVDLRGPVLALVAVSLPQNLVPLAAAVPEKLAAGFGVEPRDAFLGQNLSAWGALAFLRDEVPHDAPVALLYAWQGYHVDQPWLLGSVEDHVPTRVWVLTHPDTSLAALRAAGVRWLLVGDVFFLQKDYRFLDPDRFAAQFVRPVEALRKELERGATLAYATHHWEVWRLDAPADPQ